MDVSFIVNEETLNSIINCGTTSNRTMAKQSHLIVIVFYKLTTTQKDEYVEGFHNDFEETNNEINWNVLIIIQGTRDAKDGPGLYEQGYLVPGTRERGKRALGFANL